MHGPDLGAAAALEPPSPAEAAQNELPKYAMAFIAPPPKPSARPRPAPVSPPPAPVISPAPPVVPPPPLPPPPSGPASPLLKPVMELKPHFAPKLAARVPTGPAITGEKLDDVWLLLTDNAARTICSLLLVAMFVGTFVASYKFVGFICERANIPAELTTRFYVYMALTSAWTIVAFFLVMVPALLGACVLACNWTKWTLPERPYLRAAGTATLPHLLIISIGLLLLGRQFPAAIGVALCTPLVLLIGLKELMGLRWTATAVAALLLLVGLPVVMLITSPLSWFADREARRIAGMDEASIQKWMAEHPEEMRKRALGNTPYAPGSGGFSLPPPSTPPSTLAPATRDPLYDQLAPYIHELASATAQARRQTPEQIKQNYDRLAGIILPLKPENPDTSARWAMAKRMLDRLQATMEKARAATAPAPVAVVATTTAPALVSPSSPAPLVAKPAVPDVPTLLAVIRGDGHSSAKRDALRELAKMTPPDDATRDTVAGVMEQIVAADSAFVADNAAEALIVWRRPGTTDVMLALIGPEAWPPRKRTRAMEVLAATGERRAVRPIMQWVLKDTDAVVAALSQMGAVAEGEAISRLREKDPVARTAAARILSVVGTQECVAELRRASSDTRDAGAAATARSALETVLARLKQPKATSKP